MVGNSAMKDKTNCYIKIVCEDYCCDSDEEPIPRIHLVFRSKKDYNEIRDIEKMIKGYFKIEEKYLNTEKKYIFYYYLKEMIKKLKEYEVMEVYSDHIDAFHLEFSYISEFIHNNIELRLPRKPLIVYDTSEELLEKELKYYEEFYSSENEKYKIIEGKNNISVNNIIQSSIIS